MDIKRFETDELTGIPRWPMLLNGDWSQWTDQPCAVLYGQTHGWRPDDPAYQSVGALLLSPDWPRLSVFRVNTHGFLILAPRYSSEQALLFSQNINRQVAPMPPAPSSWEPQTGVGLTWGIAIADTGGWSLPLALCASVTPVEQASNENRLGSINEAANEWHCEESDDFWICPRRDPLTELKTWQGTVALCSRYPDEPITLLLADIDHFKRFNDNYGHGLGDTLLQEVAHVLHRFESDDVAVFRISGGVFVIWTRGQSLEQAEQLATQISTQVSELHIPIPRLTSPIDSVSLTWGIVSAASREMDAHSLLRKADELLHDAKSEQRGSAKARRL